MSKMLPMILSIRFLITVKALMTVTVMYLQRNGFNVEVLCMACNQSGGGINNTVKDCFDWDKSTLGLLNGAFFWGYAVTQAFSGLIMYYVGLRFTINCAIFLSSVSSFLIPFATYSHYSLIMFLRVLTGVGQGFLWPFIQNLVSSWSPENERSVHLSVITCGLGVGPAIALALSGVFCDLTLPYSKYIFFRNGWAAYFYFSGGIGFLDLVLSLLLITDSPKFNRFVSKKEMNYILSRMKHRDITAKRKRIPWVPIFKSVPMYAFLLSLTFSDIGIYAVWTVVPQFIADVLKFDLTSNGVYSALSYVFHVIAILLAGVASEGITTRKWLSQTNSCKLFQSVGCVGSAVCLVTISYANEQLRAMAITLLIIGFSFHGLIIGGGVVLICNDFAGSLAGFIFTIANTVSAIVGFFVPFLTAEIVKDSTAEQWRVAFLIYSFAYVASSLTLLLFGSSELQPWAKEQDTAHYNEADEIITGEDNQVLPLKPVD